MAEINIMTYTDFVCNKVIDSYSAKELIDKWNEYCNDKFDPNSQIYVNNTDFLDLFSKEDLVSNICYGEYSINDDYVTLDKNGDFKTSNYPEDLISKEKLADWIVRNSLRNSSELDAYIDYVEQNLYKLPLNNEEIKAAIKLNESEELVDLSDLADYVNLDELATDTQHSQAKTPSLADDLQAARLAANKQETVNPQGTLKHTNKL